MTQNLDLEVGRAAGALVRVLGLAERRGYPPVSVSAHPMGPRAMRVRLTVESDRPVDQLVRQLDKLYDVMRVQRTP